MAKRVPYLHGSPAIGKSDVIKQVAEKFNLKLIDIRLSQSDPTDLNGFPNVEDGKARYMPMDTFPLANDKLPVKTDKQGNVIGVYDGWLIFFDEMSSAPTSVQAAAYKILLDRQVGLFDLHEKVAMVAAGNLETDGAIVEQLSTALQSRMIHAEMKTDKDAWIKWAIAHNVDHRIIAFIEFKPTLIYNFSPTHSDFTYASPRTWAFMDSLLKTGLDFQQEPTVGRALAAGTIGEGPAREFIQFCAIYETLPTMDKILKSPESTPVPTEPSTLFALAGALSANLNKENAETLYKYISRMELEFQVVTLRMGIGRDRSLTGIASFKEWLKANASSIF